MIYVMSDLHGCFKEYKKALELIDFKDEDTLYILGDVLDRGPNSIDILLDMMTRINVYPIMGNHEYMAMLVLKKLGVEISEDNIENYLNEEDMMNYIQWSMNGGQETIKQFLALDRDNQEAIIEYLEEFTLYEEVHIGDRDYVLVHAGLEPFKEDKPLEAYDITEMVFKSPRNHQTYYKDKYVVMGHTPTLLLEEPYRGRIYEKDHQIFIDCGCVFGGSLGIYCLDNQVKYYVEKEK